MIDNNSYPLDNFINYRRFIFNVRTRNCFFSNSDPVWNWSGSTTLRLPIHHWFTNTNRLFYSQEKESRAKKREEGRREIDSEKERKYQLTLITCKTYRHTKWIIEIATLKEKLVRRYRHATNLCAYRYTDRQTKWVRVTARLKKKLVRRYRV